MASDPEGQLSDQSDIPANSEVSEVVINCVVSKDNQWRCGLTITSRPSRSACRNIECTSIRVSLACVAWRFFWFCREHDWVAKQLPSQSPGPRPPLLFAAPNQNRHAMRASYAWINSARKLAYSHADSARKNRLFCSKFCSDTFILLEFCSVSEKIFGPSGRIYFSQI